MNPAIAIPAFNRPHALARLLKSLQEARYPVSATAPTPLFISVDYSDEPGRRSDYEQVLELASAFDWPHGPKELLIHDHHIGLVSNIFLCCARSQIYGAVIVLEDDLIVSRSFYDYARAALASFADDAKIAGVSLNAQWYNGFTLQPFIPLPDDGDAFFLQLSTPQGQIYTAEQWSQFAHWLHRSRQTGIRYDDMHPLYAGFPSTEWLHLKNKYLMATDRYYVYPRESMTTNFGDAGTHFAAATAFFQVPLQHERREFRFHPFDASNAVYDGFFEIRPDRLNRLTDALAGFDFDTDLYATKSEQHLTRDYVLTTRRSRRPLRTFGLFMRPMEANVIAGTPGEAIFLARREDVDMSRTAAFAARHRTDAYFAHYRRSGRRYRLSLALAEWRERLSRDG